MTGDHARLFLGIELNEDARRTLDGARRSFEAQGVVGRFHDAALYHLTLCFLGETPRSDIPRIEHVMEDVHAQPFELTLSAPGTFKDGRILWMGVEPCGALTEYQHRLAKALRAAGFPAEEGEYRPHITLARQVRSALPAIDVEKTTFPARRVALFESARVDGVLRYTVIGGSVFR